MINRVKMFKLMIFIVLIAIIPHQKVMAMDEGKTSLQQIEQIIKYDPGLKGAIAGVSVRSSSNGRIIFDYQGDVRLRPASNMKLLTAVAVLNVLGENYTFSTEVLADGLVKKQTLNGNLFLKGNGDPTLLKSDFDHFASKLKEYGIKRINGNLVADDSWYDDVRYSLDLPWSDETTHYGAQISALTASPTTDYDAGSIKVEVKPGANIGDLSLIKITPKTNYITIINQAKTVSADGKKEISIFRKHAKNTIIIKGTIPNNAKPIREWIGVWDSTRYAASLFKQSLKKYGITLNGKIKTGVARDTARVLINHQSMPLSQLLVPFMKLSNNGHAEILVKEIGKVIKGEGSWEKGLEVLEKEIAKFGVNPATMVIRDGSGVSHIDLIPANQLTQLLYTVQKEKWFPAFLYSLPVAGIKEKMVGGSLRNRMKNPPTIGKVKAKTGTLTTVSSLSGYVTTKSGETLIFSILLNNLLDESKGKIIEDQLVTILANQ